MNNKNTSTSFNSEISKLKYIKNNRDNMSNELKDLELVRDEIEKVIINDRSELTLFIENINYLNLNNLLKNENYFIKLLDIKYRGEEILIINLSLFNKLPNLKKLSITGDIIFTGADQINYPLTHILISENQSMMNDENKLLNIIKSSYNLSTMRIGKINDFTFLNKLEKLHQLDTLSLTLIKNLSDVNLVKFLKNLTVTKIDINSSDISTIHEIYVKKDSVKSLTLFRIVCSGLPQLIINRINQYRLSRAEEDSFELSTFKTNLPDCINNKTLKFPDETPGKYRMSASSIDRFRHYIKEHHEPENFETLESCNISK